MIRPVADDDQPLTDDQHKMLADLEIVRHHILDGRTRLYYTVLVADSEPVPEGERQPGPSTYYIGHCRYGVPLNELVGAVFGAACAAGNQNLEPL